MRRPLQPFDEMPQISKIKKGATFALGGELFQGGGGGGGDVGCGGGGLREARPDERGHIRRRAAAASAQHRVVPSSRCVSTFHRPGYRIQTCGWVFRLAHRYLTLTATWALPGHTPAILPAI